MPKKCSNAIVTMAVLTLIPIAAQADEADAKQILMNMSDYLTAQQGFAFDYDATWEVVTTESQKLGIASSGTVSVARPNKIRASRVGGFADVDMIYDGTVFSLVGNHAGLYTQIPMQGTIENLVDELRVTYGRPLPAADLLIEKPYDTLMSDVTDVKDLGSGIISGRECDHLAFRTPDVDWQIWIAQGDTPYPCRYVITTPGVEQGPQYQVDIRDWRGGEVAANETFTFEAPSGASEVDFEDYQTNVGDLPGHFVQGGVK